MIYKRLVLLLAWTVLWGGFAVDQLLLTYGHMQSRNTNFIVDAVSVSRKKIENPPMSCGQEDEWIKNLTFQFDFETSEMNILFTGNKENLKRVKRLSLKQTPVSMSWTQSGFDYLNYKTINFELDNNNVKIPISISKSKFESPYYVDFIFEAYTGNPHQLAAIDMLAEAMPDELLYPCAEWLECYQVECEIIDTTPKKKKKEWQ